MEHAARGATYVQRTNRITQIVRRRALYSDSRIFQRPLRFARNSAAITSFAPVAQGIRDRDASIYHYYTICALCAVRHMDVAIDQSTGEIERADYVVENLIRLLSMLRKRIDARHAQRKSYIFKIISTLINERCRRPARTVGRQEQMKQVHARASLGIEPGPYRRGGDE
jgi:hypothetical protein